MKLIKFQKLLLLLGLGLVNPGCVQPGESGISAPVSGFHSSSVTSSNCHLGGIYAGAASFTIPTPITNGATTIGYPNYIDMATIVVEIQNANNIPMAMNDGVSGFAKDA